MKVREPADDDGRVFAIADLVEVQEETKKKIRRKCS